MHGPSWAVGGGDSGIKKEKGSWENRSSGELASYRLEVLSFSTTVRKGCYSGLTISVSQEALPGQSPRFWVWASHTHMCTYICTTDIHMHTHVHAHLHIRTLPPESKLPDAESPITTKSHGWYRLETRHVTRCLLNAP